MEKKTIKEIIGVLSNYKQMHNYRLRNIFLVLAQSEKRNHEKFVGVLNSFLNWKKQDIQILKGSKGYKVLVPIFKKIKEESKENQEEKETTLKFFKLGNIFDISQTSEYENYLKEKKEIDEKIMKNSEIDYITARNFTSKHFLGVKITEDFKDKEEKGRYNPLTHKITLYQKSSHTLFHEIGHYLTVGILKIAGHQNKEYAKNEILAELTAYLLLKKFDENIDYNFAYSNVWANRITDMFELDEFINSFNAISKHLESLF